MSREENNFLLTKNVCEKCFRQEDVEKLLEKFKVIGKHAETVQLFLPNTRHLREVLLIFPNTRTLELQITNYIGDIRREVAFPDLRRVTFKQVVPSYMKNYWKLFSNLECVTIGNPDYPTVFTSEFVNKVIQRNAGTLKILRLVNIPLAKATYCDLRVPCQLKELQIVFFKDSSKQAVCRAEDTRQKSCKTKEVFCTKEDDLTTFTDLKSILKSQNELEYLHLVDPVIDSDTLNSISGIETIRRLKLVKPELHFNDISDSTKEFFSKIKSLFISHITQDSIPGFRLILGSLKDVESLEINAIWSEVSLQPLESRKLLPNLKDLTMHVNLKSEDILKSLQFTENLVNVAANIESIGSIKELLKTSPKIKKMIFHNGENKVATFAARKFKSLEMFELITDNVSISTVLHICANASNIKRATIYTKMPLNRDLEEQIDEQLEKHFPEFSCLPSSFTFCSEMEVYNDKLDFKMNICSRSYRMDDRFL